MLAPNTSRSIQLFLAAQTTNSLLVDVKNSSGVTIAGGTVRVTKGGSYDATVTTDACGQAFFDGLTNGNYSVTASSTGYQTYSADGVDVTGTTRFSVVLN